MIASNAAIRNRVTVGVLVLLIVLAGAYSYLTLPRESAPDVPVPFVMITTPYQGVSPEDVETAVTMKIEQKLTGLKGVKEVKSSSAEGLSFISVEFHPNVRIEDALQYVRDKVDQAKADLPREIDPPIVTEVNIAEFPMMIMSISGKGSLVALKDIADKLQDTIEQNVPGVLQVDVMGGREREIRIEIDPDRLARYGLTIPEIMGLIPSENVNVSAGGLETPGTKFNVRVPAQFKKAQDIQDIRHLSLAVRNGKTVYLGDVAEVKDAFKDRETVSRLNGESSITVAVRKRVGANILDIATGVKKITEEFKKRVPQDVRFTLTMDGSDKIKLMVADLENNIGAALVLVVVVLLLTIGIRGSMVVALAVPLSMLMTYAVLQIMGYTLNMIVLFSLVLVVGMLVDDAIVIVENIYRFMQNGYGRIEAAMKATAEVGWPVITSTLTTCAAFFPLVFWPGIIGDFMKYLPITVIISLLSSLFVAMIVSPVVCTLVPGKASHRNADHPFLRGYRKLLRLAVGHRALALALCGLLLVAMVMLYGKKGKGVEFFPAIDPKNAIINIRCPQGTNILETDRLARLVESRIEKYQKDKKWIDHILTNVGSSGSASPIGNASSGPHMGNLTLVFPDYEKRTIESMKVIEMIRKDVAGIPGAEIKVEKQREGPSQDSAVTVRLIGEDLRELEALSTKAAGMIANVPGLVNLRSDLELTRPELVFKVDRNRAMLSGVSTAVVGAFLKTAVFGTEVGKFRQAITKGMVGKLNDEYDITVRLPESQRRNIEDLFRLRVPNVLGQSVPLGSLGHFEYAGGMGTINHVNQKRVVTLTADAEGRLDNDVLTDARNRLKELKIPQGCDIKYAGQSEEMEKAKAFLFKAGVIAIILIVLILVAQFNTLSAPAIIMTTVLLSLIGVLIGLIYCGLPFGVIMTGIGVISLAGIVVKNGIVLMDYTRQLQRKGMSVEDACVEAGATRLRPVLLTAACTVLGLVPTALGVSYDFHTWEWITRAESTEWWKSMAVAVIFGLSFATILTLVVVPSLYVMIFRLASRLGMGGLSHPDEVEARERQQEVGVK